VEYNRDDDTEQNGPTHDYPVSAGRHFVGRYYYDI